MDSFDDNREKSGFDAMNALTDFFNGASNLSTESFADQFSREHRTLQQSTLKSFFNIMVKCADNYDKGLYDARNEASLKACKIMVEAYEKETDFKPSIAMPFI